MPVALPRLLEPRELLPLLGSPELLILDLCKDSVYAQVHVPGAIHIDPRALVAGDMPAPGKIPSPERLGALFAALGLSPEKHVIAYDDEGGGWAGRLLWTLSVIGHERWSYLDGGIHAWLGDELPTETTPCEPHSPTPDSAAHDISFRDDVRADVDYLLAHLADADLCVWDARSFDEYTGARAVAARAGHIPGARHYEWTQAMDRSRALRLKPREQLLAELSACGITANKNIITHCQTHHRSGLTWLVGTLLGFPRMKAYDGSWSEWSSRRDAPITSGEQP